MSWRPPLCAWALAAALLPMAAVAGAAMAGPPQCRFAVPEGWPTAGVRWSGACRGGLAQGLGTLRVYQQGRVVHVYYGRLESGAPALGVIDGSGGFIAGRFEDGRAVADGDRNTIIRAFDEASAAARALSEAYRRAGNAASARFYRDKAKQLALQMD